MIYSDFFIQLTVRPAVILGIHSSQIDVTQNNKKMIISDTLDTCS